MKNRKILPLSLSIAAISLLAVGFSNTGFVASAETIGDQDDTESQATTASITEAVNVSEVAYVAESECPCGGLGDCDVAECPCDSPGDCGVVECPKATCITSDCTAHNVDETADEIGCLRKGGGCGGCHAN